MGTRGLTCVFYKGQYRVAQYGQFDHYPSGHGCDALKFAQKLVRYPNKMNLFKERILTSRYLTQEEVDKTLLEECGWDGISDYLTREVAKKYNERYPFIHREHGAEVLDLILKLNNPVELKDDLHFSADSVMCEYGYVLDLDKHKFEVYFGFNEKSLTQKDRFYGMTCDDSGPDNQPIKLVKSYSFKNLPKKKDFLKDLERDDD